MSKPPPDFNLTLKQGMVYNLILAAGPGGVSLEALRVGLFKGMSAVSVRSMICRINKVIEPQKIMSRRKSYSLQG